MDVRTMGKRDQVKTIFIVLISLLVLVVLFLSTMVWQTTKRNGELAHLCSISDECSILALWKQDVSVALDSAHTNLNISKDEFHNPELELLQAEISQYEEALRLYESGNAFMKVKNVIPDDIASHKAYLDLAKSKGELLVFDMQPLVNALQLLLIFPESQPTLGTNTITQFNNGTSLQKIKLYPQLYQSWQILKAKTDTNIQTEYDFILQNSRFKRFQPGEYEMLFRKYLTSEFSKVNNIVYNITGDELADNHIRGIAEKRGYVRRPNADESALIPVDGFAVSPKLASAWKQLTQQASQAGLSLVIVSGHRSPSDQEGIFLNRWQSEVQSELGYIPNAPQIVTGVADQSIDRILQTSSIPGYSKHHTSVTVDINDTSTNQGFTQFKNTKGYQWLKKDDYLRLKIFGFIPSYPQGGSNFGPNPEEWEYNWIGTESLENDFSVGLISIKQ
jgi:hypothetical protein